MNKSAPNTKHKSHKLLWILLIISIVILMTPVLIVGWMGLVPGVSNLMGTANPRDLGVKYTTNDIASYKQKTGIKLIDDTSAPVNPTNTSEKTMLANTVKVDGFELTQEEVTALINSNARSWLPIENTQVRLTEGTIELSGSVNIDKIENFYSYVSDDQAVSSDVDNAFSWAKMLRNNAPVYAKANAVIVDNQLTFRLLSAQIGRMSIPLGEVGEDLTNNGTNSYVKSEYFSADSAKLADGKLIFTGTYPSTIYLKP